MKEELKQKALKKNVVVSTMKRVRSLLQNKIVAALVMLITGILYIAAPKENMIGTVHVIAVILALAGLVNLIIRLTFTEKTAFDYALMVTDGLLILAGILTYIYAPAVEPYIRYVVGAVLILNNLSNLAATLKLKDKNRFRFYISLVAAIVMIGFGVALIAASGAKIQVFQQSIGVFLIVNALTNLWYIVQLALPSRKAEA